MFEISFSNCSNHERDPLMSQQQQPKETVVSMNKNGASVSMA